MRPGSVLALPRPLCLLPVQNCISKKVVAWHAKGGGLLQGANFSGNGVSVLAGERPTANFSMPCSFVTSLALLLVSRATGASQGLQDEIIASLFDKLGTTNREYVEFGFDSNEHCSGGGGSNTCRLMQQGWTGLLMDGGHKNESINLHRHLLSSRNIGHLLRLYRVRQEVDYLSADLDSADLWVVRAILLEGFRPRVFQVEYNSHFPWDYAIAFPDPAAMANTTLSTWSGTCAYGASARAFALLFSEFDYVPAAFVIGMDLFFVPRALAAHHGVPALDLAKAPLEIHFHAGAEQLTHAEVRRGPRLARTRCSTHGCCAAGVSCEMRRRRSSSTSACGSARRSSTRRARQARSGWRRRAPRRSSMRSPRCRISSASLARTRLTSGATARASGSRPPSRFSTQAGRRALSRSPTAGGGSTSTITRVAPTTLWPASATRASTTSNGWGSGAHARAVQGCDVT